MATYKIYINRGHSNTDPGAVGYEVERKLAVKVGDYMEACLKANYKCSIKGNPGTMGSLTAIANDANKWGADLVVSIHFNAGGGDGFEALVYGPDRRDLGKAFEKRVIAIGQNSRGIKYRSDLGILRLTNMPAVLVECAFVDNKKDIRDWDENAELKKMGEALAHAAADYLGLPRKKGKYYTVGKTYTLQANMAVRTGAGENYRQKKRSELTPGGKKGSLDQTYAVLKKGERVTCLRTSNDGKWIRIPSGWICGRDGDKIYIK